MSPSDFLKKIGPVGLANSRKYRVAFYGDSPTCATGFGQVSRNILPALHQSGRYEVDILGINYWGDPHPYPFKIWPMAVNNQRDPYGRQRMHQHLLDPNYQFDILFFLQDTFILESMSQLLSSLKNAGKQFKSVFYYPIDGIPKKSWIDSVAAVDYPVTYTQFGRRQSIKILPSLGDRLQVIPHGVNPRVFFPAPLEDVSNFRKSFFGPLADKFILTNVNRNQQRKDIPSTILAFKEFKKHRPDSVLYLHMAAVDQGWNLPEVIKSLDLDITSEVILPQKFTPSTGFPLELVNLIYNASDAVISTTVGEGWGLCVDESTRIATTKGFRPISSLQVGDHVVLGGKECRIRGVSSASKKIAHRVNLFGNREIIGTYEHKVPTQNRGYVSLGEITTDDWLIVDRAVLSEDKDYIYDLSTFADHCDEYYVWNKTGFSPKGAHSITAISEELGETKKIIETALKVYLDGQMTTSSKVLGVVKHLSRIGYKQPRVLLPRYINFNSDFARLLGYYTAEGSNENGIGIEFSFHKKETQYHADVQDLMYKFFGLKADIRIRENKCEIRYRSSTLAKFFGELCGISARHKRIPLLCLQHKNKAKEFLKAFWYGDGHYETNELSFCTASPQLKEEIMWLLTGFDIFSKSNYKETMNGSWSIYVNGEDYNLLAEVFDIPHRHNTFKKRSYVKKEKDCFLVKVQEVSKFTPPETQLFWDLSIEAREHFVANGIVIHNSWTEAMATKTPVIFPDNTCLGEYITEETGFPYPSGKDSDHIRILSNDNEVPRPAAHIDKMVERLVEVYDNREEAKRRAENAYNMVLGNLIWDKHINPQWVSLFDNVASNIQTSNSGSVDLALPVLKGEVL